MVKKTFNRGDWSGKSITVDVVDNIVKMQNIELKLVKHKDEDSEWIDAFFRYYGEKDWDKFAQIVHITHLGRDYWAGEEMGVSREDKDPVKVAVQMACNLI